jgi:hypothetical protein
MKRTINTTPEKSHQIAVAAAALGCSGDAFINACIDAGLMTLMEHNKPLALMMCRAGGATWMEVEHVAEKLRETK